VLFWWALVDSGVVGQAQSGELKYQAKVRFGANVAEIKALLAELQREIKRRCASIKHPDYADAGDLAYIRQRFNKALGREDKDPPAKPRARQ
jgi:hypothetical protein